MEHARLMDKLREEIAGARAGIAVNYARLWRAAPGEAGPVRVEPAPDAGEDDEQAAETPDGPPADS